VLCGHSWRLHSARIDSELYGDLAHTGAARHDKRGQLALAVEPAQIRWRRRPGLRSIERLPVVAGG
jgi:hypothetical protein